MSTIILSPHRKPGQVSFISRTSVGKDLPFKASSTATATEAVAPTMGLLPMLGSPSFPHERGRRRNRRTGRRVHTTHVVGHAVGSRACGHVVRMQVRPVPPPEATESTSCPAPHSLLVGAGHGVLEPVGLVELPVMETSTPSWCMMATPSPGHRRHRSSERQPARPRGYLYSLGDLQLAGVVVELGLHIGKAVDPGDDLSGVLAQAVQDDPQGLATSLVGAAGDADGTLGSGGDSWPARKAKARSRPAAAWRPGCRDPDRPSDPRPPEPSMQSLQARADGLGGLSGGLHALLQSDGGAHGVSPAGVLRLGWAECP